MYWFFCVPLYVLVPLCTSVCIGFVMYSCISWFLLCTPVCIGFVVYSCMYWFCCVLLYVLVVVYPCMYWFCCVPLYVLDVEI